MAADAYQTQVVDSLESLKGLTALLYKVQRIIGPLTDRVEEQRHAFNAEMQKVRNGFREALQGTSLSAANISDLADFIGLNTVRRISSNPSVGTRSRDNSVEDRPSRKVAAGQTEDIPSDFAFKFFSPRGKFFFF